MVGNNDRLRDLSEQVSKEDNSEKAHHPWFSSSIASSEYRTGKIQQARKNGVRSAAPPAVEKTHPTAKLDKLPDITNYYSDMP